MRSTYVITQDTILHITDTLDCAGEFISNSGLVQGVEISEADMMQRLIDSLTRLQIDMKASL